MIEIFMWALGAIALLVIYAMGYFQGFRNGLHGDPDYMGADYSPDDCRDSKEPRNET